MRGLHGLDLRHAVRHLLRGELDVLHAEGLLRHLVPLLFVHLLLPQDGQRALLRRFVAHRAGFELFQRVPAGGTGVGHQMSRDPPDRWAGAARGRVGAPGYGALRGTQGSPLLDELLLERPNLLVVVVYPSLRRLKREGCRKWNGVRVTSWESGPGVWQCLAMYGSPGRVFSTIRPRYGRHVAVSPVPAATSRRAGGARCAEGLRTCMFFPVSSRDTGGSSASFFFRPNNLFIASPLRCFLQAWLAPPAPSVRPAAFRGLDAMRFRGVRVALRVVARSIVRFYDSRTRGEPI